MKVLHVSPSYARSDGGPSEVLRQLVPALRERGNDVRVVTTDKGEAEGERNEALALGAYVAQSSPFPPRVNFARKLLGELDRQIRAVDVVHVHSINSYVSTAAVALGNRYCKPIFLQPHGALTRYQRTRASRFRRIYDRTVDRSLLQRVDTVVVSSTLEKTELPAAFTGRAIVLPLGVDPRLFSAIRAPAARTPFIVFLGRVTTKKRLDLVLEALVHVPLSVTLKVAGPVDEKLGWSPAALAARLGVDSRVEFLGQVSAAGRMDLLSRAAAFVLPSDDESFGVAAAEAMAAGCPAILSPRVGIASEPGIQPDRPPFQVVRESPNELASAISMIVSDADHAKEISERGRSYARAHFDWSSSARQLTAEYRARTGN